jgi:nucleoside-diphosphate-sugar epimerase
MLSKDNENFKNIRRILVTGGGGFLGQAIVKLLRQKGHVVRSLNRRKYLELENFQVEQIQGDVSDPQAVDQACRGMDAVFHVAAKTGIWGKYQAYFNTNVLGTRNIITSCLKQGIPYLIHTSSPSVAYNENAVEGADESIPCPNKYLTHYQKTKFLAERDVIQASGNALKTIVLRPRLIWGPGDNQLAPRIIARAKQLIQVGDGRNLVDTVYIDNAADAHLLAAETLQAKPDLSGNIYFISQDDPMYLWYMINSILEAAGKPPVKKSIPAGLAYVLGAILELIYKSLGLQSEPRMTRYLANELSQAHWFDISAAKKDLGYVPKVTTEEGLKRLKAWLDAQKRS